MIITKIELENFMCYAGAGMDNTFDFTEGLNVIIGDNGYGKSKLYDAFYWALYDQVYISEEKRFSPTSVVKGGLISDKAKFEAEDGTPISAIVKLTFWNPNNDKSYIVERKYSITKSEGKWSERTNSEQTLWKKDMTFLNAQIVKEPDEVKRILENLLPPNIKPYMWFQGEQVESIIDFNKHDTLNQAINVLSNITDFDGLIEIAETALKSAQNEYNRQAKLLSKDRVSSNALEHEKIVLEKRLKDYMEDEEQLKFNLAKAEERSSTLLSKIGDANKVTALNEKRKVLESSLNDANRDLSNHEIAFHKRLLKNKWLLQGTNHLFKKYSTKYFQYEAAKLKKRAKLQAEQEQTQHAQTKLQTRLPIDVPAPIYIEQMLALKRCLVCDRGVLEGDEAYQKIKELLVPPMQAKQAAITVISICDFSADFKKLYETGLALSHSISGIDDDIRETIERGISFKKRARDLNKQLQDCEAERTQLLTDTGLKGKEAEDITNEYAVQSDNERQFALLLSDCQHKIQSVKEKLVENMANQQKLTKGDLPKALVEKVTVLEDFVNIGHSTQERVFNNLIERLEAEANKHYRAMTANNKGVRGTIKLVKRSSGNYMPQLEDDAGNKLMQLNTANIILIKLATIMAIISARQGQQNDLYTLITDAPASVFSENYTMGFCKTVSEVYNQSIIMSKEFYRNADLRQELLSNPDIKLGKVYFITPSISEEERTNRNSLTTQIDRLN